MKKVVLILLFTVQFFAQQSNKKLIDVTQKFQNNNESTIFYCYKIENVDSLVFVAEGWEDGIDYSLYQIVNKDSLKLMFHFNPILIDKENNSRRYYWGYFWDISGINCITSSDGIKFYCSLDHSIVRDGEIDLPIWQNIMPVIIFNGNSTQPDIQVEEIRNEQYLTPSEIAKKINNGL